MQSLLVDLGTRGYPVHIGAGLLSDSHLFTDHIRATQVLIVSDENVAPLYLETIQKSLSGYDLQTCILPAGEATKDLPHATHVIDALADNGFHRDATVLALGGGVVGDIAGFAAACYQRGIAFIQAPTTLLAQVDASVGGKTGVNHARGKNLVGAFHQPVCVVTDTDTLQSLPDRELNAGLAEVIKHALIADSAFLEWLEGNIEQLCDRDSHTLEHAIAHCCAIKANIVAGDELEQASRALLNFGHTFAHGIEAATGYSQWLHGEAVAVGMLMAADMSRIAGQISEDDVHRIRDMLKRARLPVRASGIDAAAIRQSMGMDKKVKDGHLRLVLLESIGRAFVDEGADPEIQDGHIDTVLHEFT